MATLQVHDVTKSFGKNQVLNDVSFTIETGNIFGIFGKNGSGKSTLLKILFGTLSAESLQLEINGTKISSSEVIKKQLITYLPQHPFLPNNQRVRDIIPMYFQGEKEQDAVSYNPFVAKLTHKKAGMLSHGERKFFETILISHLPHPFLMLDEPFSMLEPLQIKALREFLMKISETKGIIITDHYYNDVLDITSKNIVLRDGKSLTVNSIDDLKKNEYLSKNQTK
ncbi:ATP-binding cassette domain-containing protein [Marixanthomonas ophiurae]|uniref:ATP-binding cassette domain-containing protein n=1 Tax=Marixanthomonas ophiurae TaxID=387659 RepID=A0A3E1QDI6_9FLAO|nr:ATP-binding cassette domain-containing protein [Marixanthomonas ophiurae]RFN60154.1 ATP-binding cassette domain-containing protein [Marixanthomonas ophiurae]